MNPLPSINPANIPDALASRERAEIDASTRGPVLLFFALSTAMGKVAEANWPAPAYISGLLLMSHVYGEQFQIKRGHRNFLYSGIGFAVVANIVIHLHLINPFLPIPPGADPTRQFHGWRELGAQINGFVKGQSGEKGYFLLADKGTTVAEAVFYSGNRWVGIDFAQPERYIFLENSATLRGKEAIILLHNQSVGAEEQYRNYFGEVEKIGVLSRLFRGEEIPEFTLRLLMGRGYRGNWVSFSGR